MKKVFIFLIIIGYILFTGCGNSNQIKHEHTDEAAKHEHSEDQDHDHSDGEDHDHEDGEHNEQEEFVVGVDSSETLKDNINKEHSHEH